MRTWILKEFFLDNTEQFIKSEKMRIKQVWGRNGGEYYIILSVVVAFDSR